MQEVAGTRHPGKHTGDIRRHGRPGERIVLAERKLRVWRPRLQGVWGEVAIPVYERLREEARRSGRLRDSLLVRVSTRQDARVLPEMAGTVGIRKSRVSRRFTEASRTALEKLGERRLEGLNLLAIDLDGIVPGIPRGPVPSPPAGRPSGGSGGGYSGPASGASCAP